MRNYKTLLLFLILFFFISVNFARAYSVYDLLADIQRSVYGTGNRTVIGDVFSNIFNALFNTNSLFPPQRV